MICNNNQQLKSDTIMPENMGYGNMRKDKKNANLMNKDNATSMSKKMKTKTGAQGRQLSMGVTPLMIDKTDVNTNMSQIGDYPNMG